MKKYLLLLLTILSAATMQAADAFTLSYCEHKIASSGGFGADSEGEISGAMFIPQERLKSLVGNEISRIDVGLISRINVRNMTVWVRSSLDGSNLAESSIERGALGWNEITLAHPYTIQSEDNGLYIGFTYKNTGSSHPVSFVGTAGKGTSFLKATAGESWRDMAEHGNISIEAQVTGNSLPLYDLSLNSVTLTPLLSAGSNAYRIQGEVSNLALRSVTGFTLTIQSSDGEQMTANVNTVVKSGATMAFTADFVAKSTLNGLVNVTISSLADGADANPSNNSCTGSVAFLRNVVVEEFTTERCSNCPAAASGFHQALESNELYATRVVPVCHHAGFYTDALTRDCDRELLYLFNDDGSTYAPAIMFDRRPIFDSNYLSGQKDNVAALKLKEDFIECIDLVMAYPTHALVGIDVKDASASALIVEVNVLADEQFQASSPVLTVYATEDDILAKSQAGASGDFYHQHVIRWDNGTWGDEVKLSNHAFSQTYTIPFDSSWNQEKMHIVAFLSNHDASNRLNNAIENAASIDVKSATTGIADNASMDAPQAIGRYTLSGQHALRNAHGVQLIRYSNGKTRKVIK